MPTKVWSNDTLKILNSKASRPPTTEDTRYRMMDTLDTKHIVGHRGSAKDAPENTLGGFEYLRRLNIHKVELDVQLTKDKQLVVFHDDTLFRTCKVKRHLKDVTYPELTQFNSAKHFKSWNTVEKIPLFEQVLAAWPAIEEIQIEIKVPDCLNAEGTGVDSTHISTQQKHYAENILEEIHKNIARFSIQKQAVITCKDQFVLDMNRQIDSTQRQGFVYENPTQLLRHQNSPCAVANELGCTHLIMDHRWIEQSLHAEIAQTDLLVSAWTVNHPKRAIELIETFHIDTVISDCVSKLLTTISTSITPAKKPNQPIHP